jgi:hypothetical protein
MVEFSLTLTVGKLTTPNVDDAMLTNSYFPPIVGSIRKQKNRTLR